MSNVEFMLVYPIDELTPDVSGYVVFLQVTVRAHHVFFHIQAHAFKIP